MQIYLFGPSCGGKSTLAKALQKDLGREWTYFDQDILIAKGECAEVTANALLETKVELVKNRVIIDAQIPWRQKKEGELYFLVMPPLTTLLERDAARTIALQRSEKRALSAKAYMINTYNYLAGIDRAMFDECFDSSSMLVEEEVKVIRTIIHYRASSNMLVKTICITLAGVALTLVCVLVSKP